MTRFVTHCRICAPLCGLLVDVEDGRVVHVAGDPDHPLTRGFTCTKGRHLGALHHRPDRFLTAQRRGPGGLEPVPTDRAIDEIASRLGDICDEYGPDAIALFVGTHAYTASATFPFAGAWLRALGSHQRYSTMTIDQSAKWVAEERLGTWGAGRQRFDDADVWLLVGTNPLVSLQGGDLTGFPIHDPVRRLDAARARGLQLLVVDPRRTEVATRADLHLRPVPGTDVVLIAALAHVILAEDLHDEAFCAEWVDGLDALRAAVDPVTVDQAAAITGVPANDILAAARTFGHARRGMAKSGTGLDMGPHANVAEHLLQALNVVCGRFPRAGDRYAGSGVLGGARSLHAEVLGPTRSWEAAPRGHTGVGSLMGELPTPALADEILHTGGRRVRCLVVAGGNPAATVPDPERFAAALGALELLVVVDPFPTETTSFAHYVIAPTMSLERPEHTRGYEHFFGEPFAQCSAAVLDRPGDVIEDWEFFFELSSRMGLLLNIGDRVWEPGAPRPTSEELLESLASRTQVPYADVRAAPHGAIFSEVAPTIVQPARPGGHARFDLLAPDVEAELHAALAACARRASVARTRPFLLTVRRSKEAMNSLDTVGAANPCNLHPDDLSGLGLRSGDRVTITSDHGTLVAMVAADSTLPRGAASLTHARGPNPGRILSHTDQRQPISLMPHMTAVPVTIVRVEDAR